MIRNALVPVLLFATVFAASSKVHAETSDVDCRDIADWNPKTLYEVDQKLFFADMLYRVRVPVANAPPSHPGAEEWYASEGRCMDPESRNNWRIVTPFAGGYLYPSTGRSWVSLASSSGSRVTRVVFRLDGEVVGESNANGNPHIFSVPAKSGQFLFTGEAFHEDGTTSFQYIPVQLQPEDQRDRHGPAPIDGHVAAITATSVTLRWAKLHDIEVPGEAMSGGVRYYVHRVGTVDRVLPEDRTEYTMTGLEPGRPYSVEIYGIDRAGNFGGLQNLEFRTPLE